MLHRGTQWALGLCVLIGTMGAAGTAQAQRLAVVNYQRAIEESVEGKSAIGKLKGEAERKQKELEQKRDELKKLDDELAKQEVMLKPDVIQKKKQELQQKFMQLQDAAMRAQRELAEREAKATQPIQDKVLRVIAQLAARDKFSMVLRSEVVLWPQQTEMDITNEVIRKVNEMKTPEPAPQK